MPIPMPFMILPLHYFFSGCWQDLAGGNRGVLETYRSAWKNKEVNLECGKKKLTCRIMTVGAPEFFGPMVKECMEKVAEKVEMSEIFEECGHSLALEKPERLAKMLKDFMLDRK